LLASRSGVPACSFCGRRTDPAGLIRGPAGGLICPGCVRVCAELMRDRAAAEAVEAWLWR
jgi:ClpX C4-type zinc finger